MDEGIASRLSTGPGKGWSKGMRERYPQVPLRLIGAAEMKRIAVEFSPSIGTWERSPKRSRWL